MKKSKKASSGRRWSVEKVSEYVKEYNFTYMENEWTNLNTKRLYQCNQCGWQTRTTFAAIKNNINYGINCPKCNPIPVHNKGKKGVSEATSRKMKESRKRAFENGLTTWNKGVAQTIETKRKISATLKGEEYIEGVTKTKAEVDPMHALRKEFSDSGLKAIVREAANYTCDTCSTQGGHIQVHHMNNMKFFPEQTCDINNLVCLCKLCHEAFHSDYGSGAKTPNTKEQYYEFKSKRLYGHTVYIIAGLSKKRVNNFCYTLSNNGYNYIEYEANRTQLHYRIITSDPSVPIVINLCDLPKSVFRSIGYICSTHLVVLEENTSLLRKIKESSYSAKDKQKMAERFTKMHNTGKEVGSYMGNEQGAISFLDNMMNSIVDCSFCQGKKMAKNEHYIKGHGLKKLCDSCDLVYRKDFNKDYGDMLSKRSLAPKKLIILGGCAGSGKSWVANQLSSDKYNYIPGDSNRSRLAYLLAVADNKRPIIIDLSRNVITWHNRVPNNIESNLVIIKEEKEILISRLLSRGSTRYDESTSSLDGRINRINKLAEKAEFSGTSEEVLEYLLNKEV